MSDVSQKARSLLNANGEIDLRGDGVRPDVEATKEQGVDAWSKDKHAHSTIPPMVVESEAEANVTIVPDGKHGRPTIAVPSGDALSEISDRYALGDFVGALRLAELELGRDSDNKVALDYADECRLRLYEQYIIKIGELDHVFNVAVTGSQLRWLGLDPQAQSVLANIDGVRTVEDLLRSHADPIVILKTLVELIAAKAIVRVA